jgi:large subunit ribosomal protein L34
VYRRARCSCRCGAELKVERREKFGGPSVNGSWMMLLGGERQEGPRHPLSHTYRSLSRPSCCSYAVHGISPKPGRRSISPRPRRCSSRLFALWPHRNPHNRMSPTDHVPHSTHPLTIYRSRTFSLLSSRRPTLPTTPTSTLSLNTTLELPTPPAASTTLTLLQARGPKRDTFDPSHRVRKRRSGFLARIRSRNGRNLIKRRLLKKRSTLSH